MTFSGSSGLIAPEEAMITEDEAYEIATAHIQKLDDIRGKVFTILRDKTQREVFGWVFYWNSAKYAETRDVRWSVGGASPIIVDDTGTIYECDTWRPVAYYAELYRKQGDLRDRRSN
jgi:hypothetical protein